MSINRNTQNNNEYMNNPNKNMKYEFEYKDNQYII